jgi:hypothetical protein
MLKRTPLPSYLPNNGWTLDELSKHNIRREELEIAILSGDVPRKNVPGYDYQQISTLDVERRFPIVKELELASEIDVTLRFLNGPVHLLLGVVRIVRRQQSPPPVAAADVGDQAEAVAVATEAAEPKQDQPQPQQDAAPEPAAAEPSPEASPAVSDSELTPETVPDQMSEKEPAPPLVRAVAVSAKLAVTAASQEPPIQSPTQSRKARDRVSYQQKRARAVLDKLCPKGVPSREEVSDHKLLRDFSAKYADMLESKELSRGAYGEPSESTVLRAAGRKD